MTQTASKDEDLLSLYQQLILDHGKSPRNAGRLEQHDCCTDGKNPLCGDKVTVTATLNDDGLVSDIRCDGRGCAISLASASMMTEAVQNLSRTQVKELFEAVQMLCKGSVPTEDVIRGVGSELSDRFESLVALSGVRQFPSRAKCATLAWATLVACLDTDAPSAT